MNKPLKGRAPILRSGPWTRSFYELGSGKLCLMHPGCSAELPYVRSYYRFVNFSDPYGIVIDVFLIVEKIFIGELQRGYIALHSMLISLRLSQILITDMVTLF